MLCFYRSANRTCTCASATVDTAAFVDNKYAVAFSNSAGRTFIHACATADARVIDLISHCEYLL